MKINQMSHEQVMRSLIALWPVHRHSRRFKQLVTRDSELVEKYNLEIWHRDQPRPYGVDDE